MPIQAPQWTDYLTCPICCREYNPSNCSPISLACGHTICKQCLSKFQRKQCVFDLSLIHIDLETAVVNTALLQLAGFPIPENPYKPPSITSLSEKHRRAYDVIVKSIEELALFLKFTGSCYRLSRPMQRKLVALVQCAISEPEGRLRAYRFTRSVGERSITELILLHQNPTQISAHLWAAVRARGCQFLGPSMQEEVLKLVLLALEDGIALSRKVLVQYVVQKLESTYPQASKTSIGHVVQLLYRASCFKVSKRESDSSLMQLKVEFRSYGALRREHDTQIVQTAMEAGLRITPDQWSSLLYGDTAHKSYMQSIVDKLQTMNSFSQSVQELCVWLQRTGDPSNLTAVLPHLRSLASIDTSRSEHPTWEELSVCFSSLKAVVISLVEFTTCNETAEPRNVDHATASFQTCSMCYNDNTAQKHQHSPSRPATAVPASALRIKYKVSMCRETVLRGRCPRGENCTFAHTEDEMFQYRELSRRHQSRVFTHNQQSSPMTQEYRPLLPLCSENIEFSTETSAGTVQSPRAFIESRFNNQSRLNDTNHYDDQRYFSPIGNLDCVNLASFNHPYQSKPVSFHESFVRSDSILWEENYSESESPTITSTTSRFGPISRQPIASLTVAPNNAYSFDNHFGHQSDLSSFYPNAHGLLNINIEEHMAPQTSGYVRQQSAEDNYELGIANEMQALEIKWENELREQERGWTGSET